MTLIPWQDIEAGAIAAQPPVVQSAYGAAKSFACGLYNDYQGYFGNIAPQGPLEGLKRGVWDKVCGPTLPPVPTSPPPWSGDTCACETYEVKFRITREGNNPINSSVAVTGPVFGTATTQQGPGLKNVQLRHGQCSNGQYAAVASTGLYAGDDQANVSITGVSKLSSGSGCQPPTPAPVPPPVAPPPERQTQPSPITIAPNVTILAPVTLIKPTINNSLDASVEISVGGLNFNFSLGGVNIDINPSFNPTLIAPTVNLPSLPPGTPRPPALPPAGGGCPPCPDVDITPVLDAIKAERKYYGVRKTTLSETVVGSGRGGNVALPARTEFVRVRLTSNPLSIKEQAGTGGPDVLYAGWCSSGRGFPGVREPISYADATYPVKNEATRFTWTLYNGGVAEVTAIHRTNLPGCVENECG